VGTNGRNGDRPHDDEQPALQAWVPGPGWQRRDVPGGRRRWDRRRWRLVLAGSGAALLLLAWGIAFTSGVRSVEPTVEDEDFLADAEALCEAARSRLTEAARARGDDELAPDEQATAVDATVDTLASMVRDLRDLRPAGADGEEVDAWLDDWERVLDSGRRTADALRRDDRDAAEDAAVAGQEPARAVNAFAGANGVPACGTTPV
jgi:hypothetical protein